MGMVTESQFHVLAVDDSLFDRKMIERLLQKSSCQVTTVDSGSKALEFLGLSENYCMPGMTGYDLLKKVKESAAFKSIPVVIMSSENVPARISRCLEEGAEEFFLKPVKLADLTKLKPHMMKTKLKNQKLEEIVKPDGNEENAVLIPEIKEDSSVIEILPLHQELESEQLEQTLSSNKRKSMEEAISTDRSRPKYNDITTSV
ncbi:unnamed protein product [Arabis nemorensis]|uniref:Response regulatory domain-containing protein n=1 Tax=Arabis nemorensis TaxID=586526 RepID=A0A565BMY9_9BRAS|nr:unnamed protein product [Arabis nemorensis]